MTSGRNKAKKAEQQEIQEAQEAVSSQVGMSRNTILMPIFFIIGLLTLGEAYRIRLMAIHEYGPVIHEFDPYFVSEMIA
jgi:hypothetical protein